MPEGRPLQHGSEVSRQNIGKEVSQLQLLRCRLGRHLRHGSEVSRQKIATLDAHRPTAQTGWVPNPRSMRQLCLSILVFVLTTGCGASGVNRSDSSQLGRAPHAVTTELQALRHDLTLSASREGDGEWVLQVRDEITLPARASGLAPATLWLDEIANRVEVELGGRPVEHREIELSHGTLDSRRALVVDVVGDVDTIVVRYRLDLPRLFGCD